MSDLIRKTVEELEIYFKGYDYWRELNGFLNGRRSCIFGLSSGYILKTVRNIGIISHFAHTRPEGEIKVIKKSGIICIGARTLVIYCEDIKIVATFHSHGDLNHVNKMKWR